MYCFFYAIAHMPLADAMLLKLSAPLFIPLVALFWLGERFTWHVVAALATGFAGVSLILVPDFDRMAPVAMIALMGGALAAVAKVTVRRLSATEPAARTVFYFSAIGTLASIVPLFWLWDTPDRGPAALAAGSRGLCDQRSDAADPWHGLRTRSKAGAFCLFLRRVRGGAGLDFLGRDTGLAHRRRHPPGAHLCDAGRARYAAHNRRCGQRGLESGLCDQSLNSAPLMQLVCLDTCRTFAFPYLRNADAAARNSRPGCLYCARQPVFSDCGCFS